MVRAVYVCTCPILRLLSLFYHQQTVIIIVIIDSDITNNDY